MGIIREKQTNKMTPPNEVTSADGGWRVLFAFVAPWPAAAEFLR